MNSSSFLHFGRAINAQVFFPSQPTIKIDEQVSKVKKCESGGELKRLGQRPTLYIKGLYFVFIGPKPI